MPVSALVSAQLGKIQQLFFLLQLWLTFRNEDLLSFVLFHEEMHFYENADKGTFNRRQTRCWSRR